MIDRDETKRQLIELGEVREVKRRRLSILQVQAARHGIDVPPHIEDERRQLEAELININTKISELEFALEQAERAARPSVPDPQSLVPVAIVPQTINEHLIALAGQIDRFKDEARREFRAVQVAIQNETDARLSDKREQVQYQAEDKKDRVDRQKELSRWMLLIGVAVVILFVLFVLYVLNQYLRDLYLNTPGR